MRPGTTVQGSVGSGVFSVMSRSANYQPQVSGLSLPVHVGSDMSPPWSSNAAAAPHAHGQQGCITSHFKLPSDYLQFSRWHDFENVSVTGDHLRSPRVREAPLSTPSCYEVHKIAFTCRPNRRDHRNATENWEEAKSVNLSFQDLGDDFQRKNFHRCLRRLIRCKELQLMDNSLRDLSNVTLQSCTHLNLSRNNFSSFKRLPNAPNLEHLSLSENRINSLSGISKLSKYSLESLVLRGNPVEYLQDYRYRVFQALPSLKSLDFCPKLHTDDTASADTISKHSENSVRSSRLKCTIN